MEPQPIKLQQNNLSYPYSVIYERKAVADNPQKIIETATSSVIEPTERGIFMNFLTKGIEVIDNALNELDKKYPDMLKV